MRFYAAETLYEVQTGKEIHRLRMKSKCLCVAVSPDGRHALSGSEDGVVRLWGLPVEEKPKGKP